MGRLAGHRHGADDDDTAAAIRLGPPRPQPPPAWPDQEAKDLLLSVANKFESNSTIHYHLALYCCGLDQTDEADQWLGKALLVAADMKEVERLRKMVLEDPDLEPLTRMP